MSYKFEFVLTDQDYVDFNIFHLNNAPSFKKMSLVLRFFVPVILAANFCLSAFTGEDLLGLVVRAVVYSVVSVAWVFLEKRIGDFLVKWQIKSMRKDGKLISGRNIRMEFNEDFICEISEMGESKINYSSVERVAAGSHAVYIYIAATQAFIVPFSAFDSEERKSEFLAFVNDKKSDL